MKRRSEYRVDVWRTPAIGEAVYIALNPGFVGPDRFALLGCAKGDLVALCDSAKRLSDWAFEHGAQSVRHDYDLKLSDAEP